MRFVWSDRKNEINFKKHSVSFQDAAQVFFDENAITRSDFHHSESEQRFNVIGLSSIGLLFVVFIETTDDLIRIISARKVAKKERRLYEEKN